MKTSLLKKFFKLNQLQFIAAIGICLLLFGLSCKKVEPAKGKPPVTPPKEKKYTNTYNGVKYSSAQPYNLTIVYFLPNDVPLDTTYETRLSALMLYGQNFYRQNMIANGYGSKTFGLFTQSADTSKVQILLVHGKQPLGSYHYADATNLRAEVDAYLAQNPTLKTSEHVLILTAIPDPNTADVPFYGTAPYCYALDYPQLDIKYVGNTGTIGNEFSVWFGGMMHELGHGLNLPHSHQTNTENNNPKQGMNLMFAGNGTLGLSPTFINRAGCSILNNCQAFAAAPGVTYYNGHISGLTSLHAAYSGGNLVVSGTYASNTPVTDVNIYQDPYATPSPGYYRVAWSVKPGTGNSFTVTMPVSELQTTSGPYNLEIELVLQNGEYTFDSFGYSYNNSVPTVNIDFDDTKSCDIQPAAWHFADIGTSLQPGSFCYTAANQNFRITSFGTGVADPSDNFSFVYQTLTGNGQIVARVKDVSSTYNYFGGIMIRNSLSANSGYICLNSLDTRGVFDIFRTSDGGSTDYNAVTTLAMPMWLKLVRAGNTVSSFYSSDNITWTAYNTYNFTALNSTIYVGLAASGSFCSTDIDNVTVTKTQ